MKKMPVFLALLFVANFLYSQNVGIGTSTPAYPLDVTGNMNLTGELKANGISGTAGQVLQSNGNNTMKWATVNTTGTGSPNGGVGYGTWGDCSTNNIGGYQPVVDTAAQPQAQMGFSVGISGNYAITGSPYEKIGANFYQGTATMWQLNGDTWQPMTKLTDATGAAGYFFGFTVAISGNYAIVGAPWETVGGNTQQGTASIYQLINDTWVLMNKITDATPIANEHFGRSVSISGDYAIVGALDDIVSGHDRGSASIFQLSGGNWVYMQKLTDATGSSDYILFGQAASISGTHAIIGAPGDAGSTGSASIYQLSGGNWVLMNKINGIAANDNFGASVSILGNDAFIGSPYHDNGTTNNRGSVHIYQLTGGNWVSRDLINSGLPYNTSGNFGSSVSISGSYALIGDADHSAKIYQRIGSAWQKLQFFTDPGANELNNDAFGTSVGIDASNKRFLIGVPRCGLFNGKVVFGKLNL